MKLSVIILFLVAISGCDKKANKEQSIELITSPQKQDSIFRALTLVTNNTIPSKSRNDSLAFLILPVQASCPSCRKKTIDSIVAHQSDLAANHYIIISASGGRKTMNGYFLEQEKKLPHIQDRLFLDSLNQALYLNLYKDKPTFYYTYDQKAFKKVSAIPATVREDLREFFSGFRTDQKQFSN